MCLQKIYMIACWGVSLQRIPVTGVCTENTERDYAGLVFLIACVRMCVISRANHRQQIKVGVVNARSALCFPLANRLCGVSIVLYSCECMYRVHVSKFSDWLVS